MQTTGLKGARLSLQQERLWLFQRESNVYRAQCAAWFDGKLDEAAFQQALGQMVEQHEILQTVIYCLPEMNMPVQVIGRRLKVYCPVVSLGGLSASLQDALLETHFTLLQEDRFDLAQGPLLRTAIFRLSAEAHLLLVSIPALCADASTLALLIAELSRRYEACLQGRTLAEEPLQYAAISAWQQKLLASESAKTARGFWSQIDLAQLAQLRLPFERAGSVVERDLQARPQGVFAPQVLSILLEEALSASLAALAQHYEVSLAAVLLACWHVMLWRMTDEVDLLIGVAGDGRLYEELAKALGLYTRFVPVSIHCETSWTFEQLLTSVSLSLQEAMKWQTYFTWTSERAAPDEGEGPGFFPVTFEYDRWPAPFPVGGVTIGLVRRVSCSEPFTLKLSALQVGMHLQLELHYDPQRISAQQATRLASALHSMQQSVVEQPQASVATVRILASSEREQLLTGFRARVRPLPEQQLHQLFEAQVVRMPSQLAAVSAEEQLTYHELNCRANQLARVLRRKGVGPNALVGLCVARSAQMIVGVLAILKAGGAYVPLDPESPPARLLYQLQDSQVALLLTEQALLAHLPAWNGQTLRLENMKEEMAQEGDTNLPLLSGPEDLAYVIYTSGTTGVPKGVMIRQRSVVNYTLALCDLLKPEPGWQFATVSTLAADLGNTAIFCALAAGGCVQVPDHETITSGEVFAGWVAHQPIDVLKIVPSHLAALLASEHTRTVLPRRGLVLGGEALSSSLVAQLWELGGGCCVYNHYGPTETTVGVLVNVLGALDAAGEREPEGEHGTVPLGRPLANTEVYVLDRRQQVVPMGVTGELYVGGLGLALGYLHQPEQTAERFVPQPFGGQAGARLYRSGDLARYTAQGQIEFVGRRDSQVKLRGYRIELGEIEAVLRRHPNVRDSVVLLREDVPGGPHLAGYIVARKQPRPSSKELRGFLREQVPEHMVPSTFVYLKALPLTANGKVDRRQLITADVNENKRISSTINPDSESKTLVLPRNMIELKLLRVWEEILQIQPISIVDNFFDLGGHSILAVRLLAHILKEFGQNLSLATLFLHPTIAELATVLRQQIKTEGQYALVAIQTRGSRPPFFCVHPAGGAVFCYINLARYLGSDQPFYGLQTPDFSTAGAVLATVEDMAAHYITAIQAVQPQGPYLLGGWSMGGVVAFEIAQQLRRQGHEIALLALIDSGVADSHEKAKAAAEKIDIGDADVARELMYHFGIAIPDDFYQLELETQLSYALEQAKKKNGIPVDTSLEQVRYLVRTFKMNSRIAHLYVPQSYQHRIDYFASTGSMNHTEFFEGLGDSTGVPVKQDHSSDWRELANGDIEVHRVPGNHNEMIEEPNVQVLAGSLKHCIDRVCNQLS